MAQTPEHLPSMMPSAPEGVDHRPESPEVSHEVANSGVVPVHSNFSATVQDDQGHHMVQAPATQTITIQIPNTQSQLDDWSKGDPTDSATWYAIFWLRLIKKAIHFGWRTIFPGQGGQYA